MFLSARLLANKQQVNNTALLPSLEDRSRHQVEAWSCHRWMSPWSIDRYFIIGLWALMPCLVGLSLVDCGLRAEQHIWSIVDGLNSLDCKLQSLCPVPVRFPVMQRRRRFAFRRSKFHCELATLALCRWGVGSEPAITDNEWDEPLLLAVSRYL